MSNLEDCEIHIGARNYLQNNFYNHQFHFADNLFGAFGQMDLNLDKNNLSNLFKKIVLRSMSIFFDNLESSLVEYGKREKIQLVHAHFADNAWYFKNIARQLNVPFFISFYGWDYEKLPHTKPEFQNHFKELFTMADRFICEGNHGASILAKHGCPKEKITVTPLGIQPDKIKFLSRNKKTEELNLIQIASFTEKKGHKKLGEYDVFIHPSCYAEDRDCEGGAPVVLLDAQATGMPVIATTHCDIPDEVIHQKTGLLSEEKNIGELAKNIKTFYHMGGEQFNTYAKNARTHVEKNYDIRTNALGLNDVYKKMLLNQ